MLTWSHVRERVAVDVLRWTPEGTLSRGIGWAASRRVPRPLRGALYGGFARAVGADLSALDRPVTDFERFDDFFTRPLRAGARPSPAATASGLAGRRPRIRSGRGRRRSADSVQRARLHGRRPARRHRRGARLRRRPLRDIYLSPRDYHRIHSPVDGKVTGYRHIPGAFFPVNPMSVRNVAGLFSINERLVTYLDSDVGRVAVVAVAATGVGHITASYDREVRTHRGGAAGDTAGRSVTLRRVRCRAAPSSACSTWARR